MIFPIATYFPQKLSQKYKVRFILYLAFILIILCASGWQTNSKVPPLILKPEKFNFTPQNYYIANITDVRKDKSGIAYLIPTNLAPNPKLSLPVPVDFAGGTVPALREFIFKGMGRNTKNFPVTIRIKEYQLTEIASLTQKGRVDGSLVIVMGFDLQRNGKTIKSIDYKGGARYTRLPNHSGYPEPTLRQALLAGLQYLNTWANHETEQNELLAQSIKITFTNQVNPDADTVFYSQARQLSWQDFKAQPRLNKYAASVFSSFAYEGSTKVQQGVLVININLKVYMLPGSSWVKDMGRDAYGLNHEQRHFDLTKLVAERFKQKITPAKLTPEDYNSILQWEYLESFREMNRLQDKYDLETQHGINESAQAHWNQTIDADLRKYWVKK